VPKRKKVGDIFDLLDTASQHHSAITSNGRGGEEKFRTSVYLSMDLAQRLNQRRMELRQRGVKVRNNTIIEAAVEYAVEELDRLLEILGEREKVS